MTRLLLDTHVLIWYFTASPVLSPQICRIIEGAEKVYVSIVSAWEIEIKRSLGRLETPDNLETIMQENTFLLLPVSLPHTRIIRSLPLHHRDPFDRMLVAQAMVENLTLLTCDPNILRYEVKTMVA